MHNVSFYNTVLGHEYFRKLEITRVGSSILRTEHLVLDYDGLTFWRWSIRPRAAHCQSVEALKWYEKG